MIVANSSPLPNIDHTMCLMREWVGAGGWGRVGLGSRSGFTLEVAKRVAMIFFFTTPPKCVDEWMYINGMFSCMLSVS